MCFLLFMYKIFIFIALFAIISCRGCLKRQTNCDVTHNYFPDLPRYDSHRRITITNHNWWVELNITAPTGDPDHQSVEYLQYALRQCGCTDIPPIQSGRPIIDVPVANLGSVDNDIYPMLEELDELSLLTVAVNPNYIATDSVVDDLLERWIKGDKIYFINEQDIYTRETEVNVATVVQADPEVMIAGWVEANALKGHFDRYLYWGSRDEINPVARAEWIEILGILVGKSHRAQEISATVNASWAEIVNQVPSSITKPTVFSGGEFTYRDRNTGELVTRWFVPGARSDEAIMINSAGATYAHQNSSQRFDLLTHEEGLALLAKSDYWFDPGGCYSRIEEYIADDNDLGNLNVVKTYEIYLPVRRNNDRIIYLY